jgi:hypothetical protein
MIPLRGFPGMFCILPAIQLERNLPLKCLHLRFGAKALQKRDKAVIAAHEHAAKRFASLWRGSHFLQRPRVIQTRVPVNKAIFTASERSGKRAMILT